MNKCRIQEPRKGLYLSISPINLFFSPELIPEKPARISGEELMKNVRPISVKPPLWRISEEIG
jgi:hypothetical protein